MAEESESFLSAIFYTASLVAGRYRYDSGGLISCE